MRQMLVFICCAVMMHWAARSAHSEAILIDTPPPKHSQEFTVRSVLSTEIVLQEGDYVKISASGRMFLGTFAGYASPEGKVFFARYNYVNDMPHGALLAAVGDTAVYFIGSKAEFVAPAKGMLVLFVNDNDPGNNRGEFTVRVEVYASKPYEQRLAELNAIRKSGDLNALVQWLTENPDWTDGLPPLPLTLEEARKAPDLWYVGVVSGKYHEGVWEVRQLHDVDGQKFPGVGAQGVYDQDGKLILNEGTPDVASPRNWSLAHPWANRDAGMQHWRTDVDLYDQFIGTYGPLNGEIEYRKLYNVELPDRFNTQKMREAQKKWEQEQVDKQLGPEP